MTLAFGLLVVACIFIGYVTLAIVRAFRRF
jgi:hypothetical protein